MSLDTTPKFRPDMNCYFCGKNYGLHLHHIYFGPNRKVSDKNGFTTYLCMEHHTGQNGVHRNKDKDLLLKRKCEEWYIAQGHSIEDFIKLIGRNYIA